MCYFMWSLACNHSQFVVKSSILGNQKKLANCFLKNFLLHRCCYYVSCDGSLQQRHNKKLIAICDLAELAQQDFDGMLYTLICSLIMLITLLLNSNQIKPSSCSEVRMAS